MINFLTNKVFLNDEAHQIIQNLANLIPYSIAESSADDQLDTVSVKEEQSLQPVQDIDFNEMTIRECVINLINSPEKYLKIPKPEGLTISEIADAVGLSGEEKLVSRILNEIQKRNECIQSQAFRLGRIFLYKYYSTRKLNHNIDQNSATKNIDFTKLENGYEDMKKDEIPYHEAQFPSTRQIDLNQDCYQLLKSS